MVGQRWLTQAELALAAHQALGMLEGWAAGAQEAAHREPDPVCRAALRMAARWVEAVVAQVAPNLAAEERHPEH
jgi:hypothetical protein